MSARSDSSSPHCDRQLSLRDTKRFFVSNPSTDPKGFKATHPSPYPFAAKVVATEEEVRLRIDSLAAEIADDYARRGLLEGHPNAATATAPHDNDARAAGGVISKDNPLYIVSVLRGSYTFTADLARALFKRGVFSTVEFLAAHSYEGTSSRGTVSVALDVRTPIAGRHVLVLEDILDTAHTLTYLVRDLFAARGAASLKVCVFLDKPEGRRLTFAADHVGFFVANEFVVGYGIDFSNRFRELPFIAILAPAEYAPKPKLAAKL